MSETDANYVGTVAQMYDDHLVPLQFQPYAEDLAARVAALKPMAVLETAAGSGAVTRVLAPQLADAARYVVSDLNAPMLDLAKARLGADSRIEWVVSDAQESGL